MVILIDCKKVLSTSCVCCVSITHIVIFTKSIAILANNRDVENDETMFYLILPADFKKQDADAEVFEKVSVGSSVSYRRLSGAGVSPSRKSLDSVPEHEETSNGNARVNSTGSTSVYGGDDDTGSVSSASSTGSKKSKKMSLSLTKFKRAPSEGQEIVYQYRVLLDGNEKFIWLQAAAELGRLCPTPAVSMILNTVDVTK